MNWTIYTDDNPPTDTSKPVHVAYDDGSRTYHHLGWNDVASNWKSRVVAYLIVPPYTPPKPELLPCRCGGNAVRRTYSKRLICCEDCGARLWAPIATQADSMWNAAMKPESDFPAEQWIDDKTCITTEPDQSDMPDEILAWNDLTMHYNLWATGDHIGATYPTTHYRKVQTCTWTWDFLSQWWRVECLPNVHVFRTKHPDIESYVSCPYCTGRLERSET